MEMLLKLLVGKLFFCFADDSQAGTGETEKVQPDPKESNAPNEETAPEFIDFEGVKVPKEAFEKHARTLYKDQFDSHDNKSKWQAENTQRAQENAEFKRDAENYRRLMDSREPKDPREAMKEDYISDMQKQFPDLDRRFLEKQFDWQMKLSAKQAKDSVEPFMDRQAEEYEAKFLAEHPKVKRGTSEYQEIAKLIGAGADSERAYQIVFFDDLKKDLETEAIKRRDDEATRKLRESRTQSNQASLPKPKSVEESFERAWAKHGGG